MQTSEFKNFHDGIVGVMSFYGKDVSQFALDVWWNALRQYDLPAINEAFGKHISNPDAGQFPPKPADIIRMLQGSTQDAALVAWAKVDKAVRHVGSYQDVVFDDPLIHRVIFDMGGWIALGTKTESDWPFVAKEFENRYRGFRSRNERPEYPAQLIGIAGAQNAKEGFAIPAPVLIGNPDMARKVMHGGTEKPLIGFKQMLSSAIAEIEFAVDKAA